MLNQNGPRHIGIGSLVKYRFPVTAITSILHRISGVLMLLYIPFVLWALDDSLYSAQSYASTVAFFNNWCGILLAWLFLSCLAYHTIAGLRHLLMDLGYFETMITGRISSWVVLALTVVAVALLGVWLWV